ncbi:Hypothetical protein SynWH7803_1673 [Synechococcus sp. WH 7803]|nr:Hypothetical protein SynWH7803_1673 [Synechococcus sp. WH 7803]
MILKESRGATPQTFAPYSMTTNTFNPSADILEAAENTQALSQAGHALKPFSSKRSTANGRRCNGAQRTQ